MKFTIVEKIRTHDKWDSFKGFFTGVLKILILLVFIPLLFISLILSIFKREESELNTKGWNEFYSSKNLSLKRMLIDEKDLPDNLDYPEESNDLYLFHVKSHPEIAALRDHFFDYQYVTQDNGIYLLSFNKRHDGMSIWFIDNLSLTVRKIKDLESSWWNFGDRNGKIILGTTLKNQDVKIHIASVCSTNAPEHVSDPQQ